MNASALVDARQTWRSTGPETFVHCQCALLHALLETSAEQWEHPWKACLFRPHMVVKEKETGLTFYVCGTNAYFASLLQLAPSHNALIFLPEKELLRPVVPICSLDEWEC